MITLTPDPSNPDKIILTQTVQVFLDKLILQTLSAELERVITDQAKQDFQKRDVQRELARLTTHFLAKMLGVEEKK